jgi:chloride channel protein, CIC family
VADEAQLPSEPVHLRSRQYLLLVGFAAVLGVAAAIVTLLFLWAEHGLQEVLWDDLPHAIGVDPHPWYALVVTTLGGLAVGLVIRFVPGHGGPGPAEGHGVGETHILLGHLPGILLAALVSLAVGASLGPEAPMLAVAATVGPWLATKMGRSALAMLFTQAGIGSIFALLFGSPLASTFLGLEIISITGHNLYVLLIPVLVASTTGFFGFRVLTHSSLDSLATFDFPSYSGLDVVHVLEGIAIGAIGAAVGLILIAVFRIVDGAFRPLDRAPVVKATLGGVGIGLVALVAGEETLFSGEKELESLLNNPGSETVAALLLIVAGKMVAISLSMATGFRGGRIFPTVFVGGTTGLLLHEAFTSVPLPVAAAAGMAGTAMVILRLPIFVILFISFFGGPVLVPVVILAAVTAYILVFDKPELTGGPPESQTTTEPGDLGEEPAAEPARA